MPTLRSECRKVAYLGEELSWDVDNVARRGTEDQLYGDLLEDFKNEKKLS